MKAFATVGLILAIACGSSLPKPPKPSKPDPEPVGELEAPKPKFPPTPAGKTFVAWLDAFNSGDEARMRAFAATYKYPVPDNLATLRNQTGGFDVISLKAGWELELRFVVKAKKSPTTAAGRLRVKNGHPAVIETFELDAIRPE